MQGDNSQFEKMLDDIEKDKVAAVTFLGDEVCSGPEMEQLKRIAANKEIPLYKCKRKEDRP